jgi:hypothetical protein
VVVFLDLWLERVGHMGGRGFEFGGYQSSTRRAAVVI